MLRGILARVVLTLATVALGVPVAVLVTLRLAHPDLAMRAGRLWSRIMLAMVGARVQIDGIEHARTGEACVFVANHQSSIDVWAMTLVLPDSARFVAKQELFRIPVFGWVLRAAGFIPIDRGNRGEAIRSLDRAAERVRGGRSVVLFPEGTRSLAGRLQPFKKGAFHLAVRAGVPVLPVAIGGSHAVMPSRGLAVHPGPVQMIVGPPIDTAAFGGDHEALRRTAHERIAARLAEIDPRALGAEAHDATEASVAG